MAYLDDVNNLVSQVEQHFKEEKASNEDSFVCIRSHGDIVELSMSGLGINIIRAFAVSMHNHDGLRALIQSALLLVAEEKEKKRVGHKASEAAKHSKNNKINS